ncbi:MFS transporter [Fusibacter bizertensis]
MEIKKDKYLQQSLNRKVQLNLFLFTSGKAVSILGSSIYTFAIGLYVLKITGSALNYATTLMLSVIPMIIISPIAGVIADRVPKKWLVVGMDLANGLLFLIIYFYAKTTSLSLSVIYISTVLLNIFTTFFGIGMEAAKPSLVTKDKLIKVNSLSKLIDSASSILGPVVGGIVFALIDIHFFILFNAISFIFSAITECFINFHLNPMHSGDKTDLKSRFIDDLKEGWHFFSHNKSILQLFFVFVSLNFLLGFSVNVPAPYIINQLLHLSSSSFGFINSMFPVGLILGTLSVEKLMQKIEFRKLLISMNGFIAILAMFIGLPIVLKLNPGSSLMFFSIINVLMGIAIAYVDVPLMTILQNEIPPALLGRVLSLIMSLVKIVLPFALITSGALIGKISIIFIPIIGASIAFLYSLYLLFQLNSKKI